MVQRNVPQQRLIQGSQCWACRERRVRCGSEISGCAKCAAKGIDCPGYGATRPLRWREPKVPKSFKGRKANTVYNDRVTPDLVVTDSSSNPFRWSLKLSAIAPSYLNYAHATISVFHRIVQRRYTALNEAHGASTELTALSDPEGATFYRYYASALKGVNEELTKTTKKLNITILAGIMMLLFSQLQQAAYGQWRVHLDGLKRLLGHYGGMERLLEQYIDTGFLVSNVLIIDTMSTTTAPARSMTADTLSWHMAYLKILPQLDYDVIPTPTPIPPHLLKVVIMINIARATARHAQGGEDETGDNESGYTLSQILAKLDITPAEDSDNDIPNGTDFKITSIFNPHSEPCQIIHKDSNKTLFTTACRSAITLYAVESYLSLSMEPAGLGLSLTQILDPALIPETAHAIKDAAYKSLMYSIRTLFERRNDDTYPPRNTNTKPSGKRGSEEGTGAYWKFIFWPLAIAGVHCATENRSREDYEYICARLLEMTAVLGTLCMRDAAVFIQRLWGECEELRARGGGIGEGGAVSWDEIFRDAPLFLL
ncbi:fungal-specific transcription factor domain-containing protein [Aspergillus keveii]|uniref:Fungal-specific transcription factor domain-containing protein n=1 Tax=Aspergillus keveii TaxID=714993 RepID=A0ABR4G674_9EURO